MDKLRINNPCPVLLRRMAKEGDDFSCKSCSKTVIDFRNKSAEEIKNSITPATCGVFHAEQLTGQKRMPLARQVIFYSLTFLSIFGFTVKPMSAQAQKDSSATEIKKPKPGKKDGENRETYSGKEENKKTKKERTFFGLIKKKKKYRVMGCPSF